MMIYDLKKLQDRNYRATGWGGPANDFEVARSDILLAIAERLEALVSLDTRRNEFHVEMIEMQKAMVTKKAQVQEDPAYIEAINNLAESLRTFPEVLSKLRGEG
jgi:hypothetical protein